MIKTNSHNDFRNYTWQQKQDHDFMFNEMKSFVENGGDLSLPLLDDSLELINFGDYIKKRFSIEFMDKLISNNLVESPFSFILKKEEKHITEDIKYGLRWMSANYEEFEKQIINSVENIAKKTQGAKLDYYLQVNYNGIYEKKSREHPLYHIASELKNETNVWLTILQNNKDIHVYMKEFLKNDKNFEELFDATYNIRKPYLTNLFYKHNLIDNYLNKQTDTNKIYELVSDAIYRGDLDAFNKLADNFNIVEIEKNKDNYEVFLSKSRTPEMALAVLKRGCFSIGARKDDENFYALDDGMNGETLSTIINYIDKDLVTKHHAYFFNKFIKEHANLDTVKTLVEQHNFPLEKYDMLGVAQKINHQFSSFESVKWFLANGADPRNCHVFVKSLLAQREEGKKALVQYKKEGLIDPFSSDMIYSVSNSTDIRKVFINYYEKITTSQLSRLTNDGKPAWFGVNSQEFFSLISNKIEDFNQLSATGDAWINSLLKHKKNSKESSSVTKTWLEKAQKHIKQNGGEKLSGSVSNESDGNFLHSLFHMAKYGKTDVNVDIVAFVFENVDADFVKLINQKNSKNNYPLQNFFFYNDGEENVKNEFNNKTSLSYLIKKLDHDFPFEQEIKGEKIIDLLKNRYEKDLYQDAYISYTANKLEQNLPEKSEKKKGVKI